MYREVNIDIYTHNMASKLQAPVSCKLCETEKKINWKCYECDLLMCDRCKEKIHPNIRNARDHKVTGIQILEIPICQKLGT
jgi:hypothetical protein